MPTRLNLTLAILALACVLVTAGQARAQWGSLSGRFIYDGQPIPIAEKVVANKDPEVCGQHDLHNEWLEVTADGGLQNALIFLRTENVDVAPSYADSANAEVVIETKNCRYEPHVAVMRTTQTLTVKNCDQVGHNTSISVEQNQNQQFHPIIAPELNVKRQFAEQENFPARIGCNIHPWEGAWLVVRKTPYAAVSDKEGNFEIKDLPVGKALEFQLWQEKVGYLKEAKNDDVKIDVKGRFKLTIKPGENKLGDIKISPSLFASIK